MNASAIAERRPELTEPTREAPPSTTTAIQSGNRGAAAIAPPGVPGLSKLANLSPAQPQRMLAAGPVSLSNFIGREQAIAAVRRLLPEQQRLLQPELQPVGFELPASQ